MKRRQFLTTSVAVAAAAPQIASPAVAQSMPQVKWRLTSSFPKALDAIHGAAELLAKAVAEATDNRFQIEVFAEGAIVPGLKAADAVTDGKVDMCHTASYYFTEKDPAFAFGTTIPFGLNARQQNAWFYQGGGMALLNEFYRRYNLFALPGGNTGAQMGGWFRKEIRSVADLQGLKMRVGGLAGEVLQKVGVVPRPTAGGEILGALENGNLDGAEWVGPYDDEKLGLQKAAPFYYFPGWWEGSAAFHFFINAARHDALPASYRSILASAAALANVDVQAKYDTRNPAALKRLVGAGTQLRPFPADVMDACFKAASEVHADIASRNADFRRIHDAMLAFRSDQYLWWQIAEYSMDTFMIRSRTRG